MRSINILFGGEAGQGIQTIGLIFSKSLVRSGFSVHVTQTYESRIRGGHNTFAIRFGKEKVLAPTEKIDLLVALNEETIKLHRNEISPSGVILGNIEWRINEKNWIGLPHDQFGKEIYWNTALMGVVSGLLELDKGVFLKTIKDILGQERFEENRNVFEDGYNYSKSKNFNFEKFSPPKNFIPRLLMNGHEAVALGAISSGLKFCAYYPMSPSTSIAQTLIDWAKEMDLVVVQAEDEISAINLSIGASYAGAPSLVPTSGGGFALMVETVSLSAISETPLVIVVAQRPGPATGLPTRTEQGDLWFVLHAGHGEFCRAIFTPGTIEECFYLTRKAFEIAEKYQCPVFILTDHFIADSYRDTEYIDVEKINPICIGSDPKSVEKPYFRYRITESGISPRLIPGVDKDLVIADSHEHKEDGHINEDLLLRPKMVEKRLRKAKGLISETIPPTFFGDREPDILLICWGSNKGSVEEASYELRNQGMKVATLHFSQPWPLLPDQFLNYLEGAKEVICIENNATGQFAQLIRRETGFRINKKILRYDGLTITPEYILRNLNKEL